MRIQPFLAFLMLLAGVHVFGQNTTETMHIDGGGALKMHSGAQLGLFGDAGNDGLSNQNEGATFIAGNVKEQAVDGSSLFRWNVLRLDNPKGVFIYQAMEVSESAIFFNGHVRTLRAEPEFVWLHFLPGAVSGGESDGAHVDGYARKSGFEPFLFPIGDGKKLRTLEIAQPPVPGLSYTAAFFSGDPSLADLPLGAPFPTDQKEAGVERVCDQEFWDLDGAGAVEITLSWGPESRIADLTADLKMLRVVGWDGTEWDDLGQSAVAGDLVRGTITSQLVVPDEFFAFTFAAVKDTDGDNIADNIDIDDDNDGLPDVLETTNDTDLDGVPNHLDLDSDNDGLPDLYEGGVPFSDLAAIYDTDKDGAIEGVPFGQNGLADGLEDNDSPLAAIIYNGGKPLNSDPDKVPDFLDLDSDNDGIDDVYENRFTAFDLNLDGMIDLTADPDGDGIQNVTGLDAGANVLTDRGTSVNPLLGKDQDADGLLNLRDLDSDSDGFLDLREAGFSAAFSNQIDPDFDGRINDLTDPDLDGIIASVDGNLPLYRDAVSPRLPDDDNDGLEDFLDLPALASVRVKVLLQGAMLASMDGLMRDDLRKKLLVPVDDPYRSPNYEAKFIHHRNPATQKTNSVILSNTDAAFAVVDWVFLELRDKNDPKKVVATRAALVQRDGDVVSAADGFSPVNFEAVFGEYFVAVRHRNHLGAMTAKPIMLGGSAPVVDFRTMSDADVFHVENKWNGLEMAVLPDGRKALWAGDATGDGKIKLAGLYNDPNVALTEVLANPANPDSNFGFVQNTGYFAGDVNMDGQSRYDGLSPDTKLIYNTIWTSALNSSSNWTWNRFLQQLP